MIFNDIVKRFPDEVIDDQVLTEPEFARWHMDNHRYIISTLIVIEAIITFAIIVCNGDPEDKDTRDTFRKR